MIVVEYHRTGLADVISDVRRSSPPCARTGVGFDGVVR